MRKCCTNTPIPARDGFTSRDTLVMLVRANPWINTPIEHLQRPEKNNGLFPAEHHHGALGNTREPR